MITLALNRFGNKEIPSAILNRCRKKRFILRDGNVLGYESGYAWYQAPVETQSMLIEAYDEIAADQKSVDEMKIWLLKQKQTQDGKPAVPPWKPVMHSCCGNGPAGNRAWSEDRHGTETIDPLKLQYTKRKPEQDISRSHGQEKRSLPKWEM